MTDRRATKRLLKIIIISFFLLCFLGYTGYEIQKLFMGPKIVILSPTNGAVISNSEVEVSGTTKNINDISLDDRKIFVDEQGNFDEKLLLSYGYNVISIKASDKFGRKVEKVVEVTYK